MLAGNTIKSDNLKNCQHYILGIKANPTIFTFGFGAIILLIIMKHVDNDNDGHEKEETKSLLNDEGYCEWLVDGNH